MRNWLLILFVVLVALVGYRLGAHPVRAESNTPAFSYGQTVLLFSENGRQQQQCAVHRQAGDFVKCGDQLSADGGRSATVWYNLRFIERVEELPSAR
jgi:hypothetical protein